MAQLSRTRKYQDLRNQLEEETTAAQSVTPSVTPSRLSRTQSSTLSHATRPVYPHEELNPRPIMQELPKSDVIDDLLSEVKQYNVDNGYRYTDDTQINILKQLDGTETRRRNAHFVPMEEDNDDLGDTMQMSKPVADEVDGIQTFMPNQKLTRINPVGIKDQLVKPSTRKAVVEEPVQEKIVLSNEDINTNKVSADSEEMTFFSEDIFSEFDRTSETESIRSVKRKPKKVKKSSKRAVKVSESTEELPSAKMRMKAGDIDNAPAQNKAKKTGTILNVVLGILIVLLLISICVTVYFVWQMGL